MTFTFLHHNTIQHKILLSSSFTSNHINLSLHSNTILNASKMRLVILLLTSILFGVGLASPIGIDTPTEGNGGVTDEWPGEYRVEAFTPPYLLSSAPTTDSSLADTVTFDELAPSLDDDAASDKTLADAPPSASDNFILPPGQIITSSNEFVDALGALSLSVYKRDTSTTDISLVDTSLSNAILGDTALTENTPSLGKSAEPLTDASYGAGIRHCESGGAHSCFRLRDTSTTDSSARTLVLPTTPSLTRPPAMVHQQHKCRAK